MKKISLLMALVVAILLSSCSKQKSEKLIPEDATFVIRFDVMQTTEKSGLNGEKSELKNWLREMLSNSDMSKKTRDKILDIAEDPTKSGIDFTEPVYMYASLSKKGLADFGFVGNMASRSDLTSLLDAIAKETDIEGVEKTNSGASYLEMGSDAALIFTDDWFFAGLANDVDDMVETLLDRIEGIGTLDGHKALDAMCSKKGVMQFLMLYGGLSSMPEFNAAKKMMPEGLDMEDMAAVADLELTPGEALFTSEIVCLSKECQEYFDKAKKIMKPISKEQTKYVSDSGLSIFINLNPNDLFEYVEKIARQTGADEEELETLKQTCEKLTGEAAFDMYTITDDGPQMAFYAGTTDSTPFDTFESFIDDPVKKVADTEYEVPTSYSYDWDEDYNMTKTPKTWGLAGFRNGLTFFATDKEHAFATPHNAYPTDKIKGTGFFLRFNFQMLNSLQMENAEENMLTVAKEVANTFGEAELYYTDDMKAVMRLTNTDKKKTAIEAIIDLVKKFID